MSECYRPFLEHLGSNPNDLRDVMQAVDRGKSMDERFIDEMLGIPRFGTTMNREFLGEGENFNPNSFTDTAYVYEGTKYPLIRKILHEIQPKKDDIIYDIGSGYGRFCMYGALTTEATFKGVEAVETRHQKAVESKEALGVSNVEFLNANALDVDYSDGTIFYLFNPFYPFGARTQMTLEAMLWSVAKVKPIIVVTASMPGRFPLGLKKTFKKVGDLKHGSNPVEIFQSTLTQTK